MKADVDIATWIRDLPDFKWAPGMHYYDPDTTEFHCIESKARAKQFNGSSAYLARMVPAFCDAGTLGHLLGLARKKHGPRTSVRPVHHSRENVWHFVVDVEVDGMLGLMTLCNPGVEGDLQYAWGHTEEEALGWALKWPKWDPFGREAS